MNRFQSITVLVAILGISQSAQAWTSLQPTYPGTSIPDYSAGGYISQPGGGGYTELVPVTGSAQIPDPSRRGYLLRDSSDDTLDRLRNHLHEDDAIDEMRHLEHRLRMERDD